MTNDEIREAIALTQGYEKRPDGFWREVGHIGSTGIPDYPNDLNAIHEVMMRLPKSKRFDVNCTLMKMMIKSQAWSCCDDEHWGVAVNATARQRCEAYLRTKGLWKNEP